MLISSELNCRQAGISVKVYSAEIAGNLAAFRSSKLKLKPINTLRSINVIATF